MSFRTWLRRFKASLTSAMWSFLGLVLGSQGMAYTASIDLSTLRFSRISNSSVLQGPTLKIVGVLVALAVMGILAGLSFFNASQQKGINNSIGVAILILPVVILVLFIGLVGGKRKR